MPELPTTFGKYYLTEKLATGGMAEIYLAKLIGPGGFEKQLVLKQIHPRLSGQRQFVDMFVAEAKTLVSLAHGNIVPVYELGVIEDTYFIAMDYIDGPTLYRLTEIMAAREAVMEPALAAWIAARILEGLDYAHRKGEGVIHRDLSPRNVMLSRDGEVKLVDFGIAVSLGEPGEQAPAQSAAPTGSFPYMSPEQVRREALTGQSDLFSLGVLFWEMLVGKRLFARPEPETTLAAVLQGNIARPSAERPEVPAKLDEIVMRALERDTAARWPDAAEMLAGLNKFLYSLDATPTARDVAALVAKFCPPSARRLPTHVEAAGRPATEGGGDAPAGPRTAVIPRDAQARGKPKRAQTFATNVELAAALGGGGETSDSRLQASDSEAKAEPEPEIGPRPSRGEFAPRRRLPGQRPPGRTALLIAGIGAVGLSIFAVVMFFRLRDRVLVPPDADMTDGPRMIIAFDAAPDAPADAPTDAPPADAALPPDAAGARPSRDATVAVTSRADAAIVDAAPRGTATLKIGADPWGKVFVDGKLSGTAPTEIPVPAGHHTIEIVFDAETPARKQTFSVDLSPGETKSLQADFH
jgi:tRNA A-37 threonylcarbamoyl transferase component Bud32